MKKFSTGALALLFLYACGGGGDAPLLPDGNVNNYPDANNQYPDAGLPPPPPPQNITVDGRVVKLGSYLGGTTEYVGGATILALGVNQLITVVSEVNGVEGAFSVDIPANGQVVFSTSKLPGYYPTHTQVTAQQADIANQKLYLTEIAWLDSVAAAHNVDRTATFACHGAPAGGLDPNDQCIYTAIVGRILDDGTAGNGTLRPVEGISAADFTITGGPTGAAWYVKGPYFLDANGTPNAANTASVVVNDNGNYTGGLFVTFVEVPATVGPDATYIQLSIVYTDPVTTVDRQFGPQSVQVYRGLGLTAPGVTWASVYETGVVPPPPPGPVDFDSQIYPLFLPVNQGGLGCQGCHTNQGGANPAGGFNLYGGADVAYASLDPANYPQRVNVATPAQSRLLTKPLYEANGVQDHPIFAFASTQDPGYQLIYRWIQEGAQRNPGLNLVSFRNDIRPLLYQNTANGGIGCYSCHVQGVDAATAPGGFYMGGTPEELYAELTAEAPTDNSATGELYRINKNGEAAKSLLLTNPLYGNPELHPQKPFQSNVDPRYQLIYRWIQEGYTDDGAQ